MTKVLFYLLTLLLLFVSCREKVEKSAEEQASEIPSPSIHLDLNEQSNEGLQDWVDYYTSLDTTFSLAAFALELVDTVRFRQGNVLGNFEEGFDSMYADFLVYSPNRKKYIDFDSYLWALDEQNKPEFSPDQEINLVDIESQTITRIGFNGPSQWLELALWKNDSIVFLFESSSEQLLRISELHLSNKERRTFLYPDTLDVESNYFNLRLQRGGISFD